MKLFVVNRKFELPVYVTAPTLLDAVKDCLRKDIHVYTIEQVTECVLIIEGERQ